MESKSEPDPIIYTPLNTSIVDFSCVAKSATYDDLFHMFSKAGYLIHLRYFNGDYTLAGFGYAAYETQDEAKTAVELFDYHVFHDKVLRVTFPRAEDRADKTNANGCPKVTFRNVNMVISEDQVRELFAQIGQVVGFKLRLTELLDQMPDASIRGDGFVEFKDEATVKLAIEKLNHLTINDICMHVEPYISEIDRRKKAEAELEILRRTVVVKNFSKQSSVRPFCSKIGLVVCDAYKNGECHITFPDIEDAESAIQKMNEHYDGSKSWSADWALSRCELDAKMKEYAVVRNSHIVVKNLDELVNDKHLKEMFSQFGYVKSWKVELDSEGNSTGTGYVSFSYAKDAIGAVNEMNGKMVCRKKRLSVAFDVSKAEKPEV